MGVVCVCVCFIFFFSKGEGKKQIKTEFVSKFVGVEGVEDRIGRGRVGLKPPLIIF